MLSERIFKERKAKKLSQEGLANLLGTSKATISNYENGHSTPTIEMFNKIIDVLGVSADYLLGRSEEKGGYHVFNFDISKHSENYLEINGVRLSKLRIEKNIPTYKAAFDLKIDENQYICWEKCIDYPTKDKVKEIAEYFQTTIEYLTDLSDVDSDFFEKNELPNYKDIPLLYSILNPLNLFDKSNVQSAVHYPFRENQPDFAWRVEGEFLKESGIDDGDIIYFKKSDWFDYSGQIVAVFYDNENIGSVNKIEWSPFSSKIMFSYSDRNTQIDKEFTPSEFKICGVYIGHFKASNNLKRT